MTRSGIALQRWLLGAALLCTTPVFAATDSTDKNDRHAPASPVSIEQKWNMPRALDEISGISWMGDNRFAAVQDESGKIFIYNTASKGVEKEISFAGAGDYEGITVVGSTAWVLRSDGRLFEVRDFNGAHPQTSSHATPLTAKQNVEGICYDRRGNRLLLAIKGAEEGTDAYKGIYAFDLRAKTLYSRPVFTIRNPDGGSARHIRPSGIAVHPRTGDIYVVDGSEPGLIVISSEGVQKQTIPFAKSDFRQPEGITFSPAADLFISNEGKHGEANILQVEVKL